MGNGKPYYKRAYYRRSARGNYIKLPDGSYQKVGPGCGKYTRVEGMIINASNITESKSLWDESVIPENRMVGGE